MSVSGNESVTRGVMLRPGVVAQQYGDAALLVSARLATEDENWFVARHLCDEFERDMPRGVRGTIAAYDSILIEFDCTETSYDAVLASVGIRLISLGERNKTPSRTFLVPCAYGGEFGPDLTELAAVMDICETEVIDLHSGHDHLIRAVLSPAGAPMTDLTLPHQARRRASPRVRVPAGSVAVAGRQAIIYATPSPGGWQLIGRTPLTLFDTATDPPVRHRPGDFLRFLPIPAVEFAALVGRRIEVVDE